MEIILVLVVLGFLRTLCMSPSEKKRWQAKAQWDADHLNRYDVLH